MPKKIKLMPCPGAEELEDCYRDAARDPVECGYYQIVRLIARDETTTEVMEATGYARGCESGNSRAATTREALSDRRRRSPGAGDRALLDREQREELSEALEEPPPDGGTWNSRKVAERIEERTGRRRATVRAQRGWEYLEKLDRSLRVPRPRHREAADLEGREAFEKVSPRR